MLKMFFTDESGQGMVEYAFILALVVLIVIGAVAAFGVGLNQRYNKISEEMPT